MLINDKMITMVEQQSTINMNMPLRFLEYLTRIYEKIIPQENRYKKHLVKIPMPEFYVLYNGQEHIPNEMTLKLSDAFINDSQTRKFPLELTVKVFKIQGVGNVTILQKCAVLSDYSKLIDYVQQARMSGIETPLDYAVQRCIKEKILPDYLKKNSTEVRNMLIGEYDYATDIRVQRQEAREEGVEAGIAYQSAKYEKIIAEITSQKDAEIERLKKALEEMKAPKIKTSYIQSIL